MADDDLSLDQADLTAERTPERDSVGEELPERMRVHSLARVLGTTTKRVLDALTDLDGRSRSAQSSVDKTDAARVRDVLASHADAVSDPVAVPAAVAVDDTDVPEVPGDEEPPLVTDDEPSPEADAAELPVVSDEDVPLVVGETTDITVVGETTDITVVGETTDILVVEDTATVFLAAGSAEVVETVTEVVVSQADYMPLFVAPQPVALVEPEDEDDDEDEELLEDEPVERPSSRRRRRGRRGRGRGRGEQGGADGDEAPAVDGADTEESDDADEGDEDGGDEDATASEGASRRRRRRRRRKSGSGEDSEASPDDPPNTVVHERAPRSTDKDDNEIQGISGSTRLEAKRQRRRDGRDAGRRRPPILSEAEFLARREAVQRVMVVRDKVRSEPPHEGARYTQIAVLEDGVLVEHFVTSAASSSLVGNIYLGIVQNVLPSMEAAFIDIGRGRNGVLYAGEVNWEAAGLGGANRKIEQALKPGDYVVVQVSKDPVGHKGARLTTQVSLAGRYLVFVPGASSTGISRKLPDTERQRLKEILREVVPADAGVIIRTASEGVKEDEIRSDVNRLQERWNRIQEQAVEIKAKAAGAAVALYEEPDVLVKVIRDLFNEDFSGLIVSGDQAWTTINDYVTSVAPDLLPRLNKYETPAVSGAQDGPDVFVVHRIDEQLAKAMDRKVWLPSGGTLVIDRTEAMTVVDVNTGKFTGSGGNLEETVTRNNLEAAEEIVRQLRLRDIGGIVVIDFIDMVLESNRDLVLRRLTEALARDRTRHQVSEVTSLGLVQLTRKRLGTGLIEAFSTSCQQCSGRGILLHTDPVESAAAPRKSEPTGRRSRRARKARTEESAITKVPAHAPGEHPLFKAMAAASGKRDDEDLTDEDLTDEDLVDDDQGAAEPLGEEIDESTGEQAAGHVADEDLDDDDEEYDESDEEDEDELDVDLDEDESELDDLDIDLRVDETVANAEALDEPDEVEPEALDEPVDNHEPQVLAARRRPRRSAARPAGPPRHDD